MSLTRVGLNCACDGGELLVLERDNGSIIASLPLPGTPDVVMLDAKVGQHTAGWDPVDRALYVFCPQSSDAIIYAER